MKTIQAIFIALCIVSNVYSMSVKKCDIHGHHMDHHQHHQEHHEGEDHEGDHEVHWGYEARNGYILPSDWPKVNPQCADQAQSPIDIDTSSANLNSSIGKSIEFMRHQSDDDDDSEIWTIENNCHSIKFTPQNVGYTFKMEPQDELFHLLQMHFHWRGSEHEMDGQKYAGEIHLVFRSADSPDTRLSVVGFFIELEENYNVQLAHTLARLSEIKHCHSKVTDRAFNFRELIPQKVDEFYRYTGSLTTPSCDEIVTWNVANVKIGASERQMVAMQGIWDYYDQPILTNSRPVQPLNGREVNMNFV